MVEDEANFLGQMGFEPETRNCVKKSFPEPDCSSLPEQKIDEPESGTSQGTEDGMFFFLWRKEEEERGEEPKRRKDERPPSTTETNPWKRKTERKWEWEWEGEGEREKVREGGGARGKNQWREKGRLWRLEKDSSHSHFYSLYLSHSLFFNPSHSESLLSQRLCVLEVELVKIPSLFFLSLKQSLFLFLSISPLHLPP